MAIALFTAGWEYRAITAPSSRAGSRIASGAGTLASAAATQLLAAFPLALAALAATALVGMMEPWRRGGRPGPVAGPLYFGAMPSFLLLLQPRWSDPASAWVWLALAVTWGGDVGGYVAGTLWGRRPLAPLVSPAKTLEGAAGALVLGCLLALAAWRVGRIELPLPALLGIALAGQALAQAGDLLESRLKRSCGVKDSGRALRAGGGMLDCVDGLCLAAPWVYFASNVPWR